MGTLLDSLPVWALALTIFSLRVVDMSLGTLRTIAVVNGRIRTSFFLGMIEVTVWIVAISGVISKLSTQPILPLFYALGFATGNAVGILLDRRLAFGSVVLRIIANDRGEEMADRIREAGQKVTTFTGQGRDGERTMIYVICLRRELPRLLDVASTVDPQMFYVVEPASASNASRDVMQPSGWRARFKKK